MSGRPFAPTRCDMSFPVRALISICCGLLLIMVEWRACPPRLEQVLYWSEPLFRRFFPDVVSGQNPLAELCGLVLNSVVVTAVVFVLLPRKRRGRNEKSHAIS